MTPQETIGYTCRDSVTGFTGVVVGVVFYISGCTQALVVPPAEDGKKLLDGQWFDVQRLKLLPLADKVVLDNAATPGPDAAPSRSY